MVTNLQLCAHCSNALRVSLSSIFLFKKTLGMKLSLLWVIVITACGLNKWNLFNRSNPGKKTELINPILFILFILFWQSLSLQNNFSFSGEDSLFVTKNWKGDIKFWTTDPSNLTWNPPNTDNQSMVSSCSTSFSVTAIPDFTELARASP